VRGRAAGLRVAEVEWSPTFRKSPHPTLSHKWERR